MPQEVLFVPDDYVSDPLRRRFSLYSGLSADELEKDEEARQAVVDHAKSIGMVVVTDAGDADPDDEHTYTLYGGNIPRKEEEAELRHAVDGILIPPSLTFEQYTQAPFLPVLAKAAHQQGGAHKYLLENPGQWQRFLTFIHNDGPWRNISDEDRIEYENVLAHLDRLTEDDPGFDNQAQLLTQWEQYISLIQNPVTYKHDLSDYFVYQPYIETPGDRFTSFRVLAAANGTILASSLLYSDERKQDQEIMIEKADIPILDLPLIDSLDYLTHPDSLVFLGARKFQSNKARGGSAIVLDPNENSKPANQMELEILEAHGINPNDPRLPDELRDQSQKIARTIGKRVGIVVGIDFIQQAGTDDYHYLETNAGPGHRALLDAHYRGVSTSSSAGYELLHTTALDAIHRK